MESEEIMHCAKTQVCQLQWKNDHSFFYLTVFAILLSSYSILLSDCYDCYLQDLLITARIYSPRWGSPDRTVLSRLGLASR